LKEDIAGIFHLFLMNADQTNAVGDAENAITILNANYVHITDALNILLKQKQRGK